MTQRRIPRWAIWVGIPVLLIALAIAVFRWDWLIPIVEARASATLQRPVHITHLHVGLGRILHITAEGVTVDNPKDWPAGDPPLVNLDRLDLDVDAWAYLRHGQLVIPTIGLQKPVVALRQAQDGATNYALSLSGSASDSAPSNSAPTQISALHITDGTIDAKLAKLRTDATVAVATQGDGDDARIVAQARGTYGGAPVTADLTGGALLSLRDGGKPWPVTLKAQNGGTRVSLDGTLQDPVHLAGANLKLLLSGPDMGQLEPLTGIPIPKTPPYKISGNLDFADRRIQFRNFQGQVGNSDLEGTFDIDPTKQRPELVAKLASRRVDLTDLGGFLGANPGGGKPAVAGKPARTEAAPAKSGTTLLPNTPINLPRLTWADIHLTYRGHRIEGRSMPLDDLSVALDIDDGVMRVHPVSFGVGQGKIVVNATLTPQNDRTMRANVDIDLRQVDVGRLMAATHAFGGAGTISGTGRLDTFGNSVASFLANGNGGLRFGMAGGDLSALLVDLSGLQFGNALLSALGVPQRTQVECLVGDLPLERGIMSVHAFVIDTGEGIINGAGSVNMRDESLDLSLRTEAKHFTIGSLPTPINIGGTFRSPAIRPGAEGVVRGGIAAGLAAVFPPLAALPTIQFGVGDDHRCESLLSQARQGAQGNRLPTPKQGQTPQR
ncbi:MAG: AsmA family protein [Rhodospirillales bacterium]|nr:AsmA family protein [Rhodospirillales bacterium]